MSLTTNLKGRVKNTILKKSHALFPFFEAVVNSIHAIEDRKDIKIEDGIIDIKIVRKTVQSKLTGFENDDKNFDIEKIEICDNGIGFTDENLKSFMVLDSDYKEDKGCKGIGRLLWLKVFENITINSYFKIDKISYNRHFDFNIEDKVSPPTPTASEIKNIADNKTIVTLNKIINKYKNFIPKNIDTIARNLIEHCLWYFIRQDGHPKIVIQDKENIIDLNTIFKEYTLNIIKREDIYIGEINFKLNFVKSRNTSLTGHTIFYCAADRVVRKVEIANKIPGLYKKIYDDTGQFSYLCFVSSDYLDVHVTPDRTDFDFKDKNDELQENKTQQFALIDTDSITLEDITNKILNIVAENLKDELENNIQEGKKRVTEYVDKHAPKYKPIVNIFNDISADPDISDKDLDTLLYKRKTQLENEIYTEGRVLSTVKDEESFEDYKKKFTAYIKRTSALKMSDLAQYVANRKVVLDFLEQMVKLYRNGKYHREEDIHQLIMPMRTDNSNLSFLDSNLWLIDDRLTFYNYVASDKALTSMPILETTETKEPDILGLNIFDNPMLITDKDSLPLASITIIEIKRPMRDDYNKDNEKDNPIKQVFSYVNKIREGKMRTKDGRPIPKSDSTPAFCYILADLTPSLIERANDYDLTMTSDGMGFFGTHRGYQAYIEIISFDKLINAAKERNAAFFDKLGI